MASGGRSDSQAVQRHLKPQHGLAGATGQTGQSGLRGTTGRLVLRVHCLRT